MFLSIKYIKNKSEYKKMFKEGVNLEQKRKFQKSEEIALGGLTTDIMYTRSVSVSMSFLNNHFCLSAYKMNCKQLKSVSISSTSKITRVQVNIVSNEEFIKY